MQQTCHTMLLRVSDPSHIEVARLAVCCGNRDCELDAIKIVDVARTCQVDIDTGHFPVLVRLDRQAAKLDVWAMLCKWRLSPAKQALSALAYPPQYIPTDALLSYQAGATQYIALPQKKAQFILSYARRLRNWSTMLQQRHLRARS